MIRLQTDLTAIPAISPESGGDGEYQKSRLLLSRLTDFGLTSILEISAPDARVSSGIRPNLFATVSGNDMEQAVWILTHMDVVPPGERSFWEKDPYQAYVKGDRIYGSGTEDNQQDLVASIFAARVFMDEGIIPDKTIGLAMVADEETNSQYGLQFVLNHPDNPFRKNDLFVVPDAGNEDGSIIEVAEKSILWVCFKTMGKQCHASRPAYGRNAFLAASHLIALLYNSLHESFDAQDDIYDCPSSTFEPTKKKANVSNVNTIPGEDIFYMDCRILPQYPLSDVTAAMRRAADEIENRFRVTVEMDIVQQGEAPTPTPADAAIVVVLRDAIRVVYGVEANPRGIGGNTVAAFLRRNGYPAAVWSRHAFMAHQPNEYCFISNMIGNAKAFAYLFMQHP
jgi:succinyl-diaminopimelate desuccinylase